MEKTTTLIVLAFMIGLIATPTAVCIYQIRERIEGAAEAAIISSLGLALFIVAFVLVATGVL